MAGNHNSGGKRKNSGRKSTASKILVAGFTAPWFTPELQKTKWQDLVEHPDPKIRVDALKYLTDRIHGRAHQSIDNKHSGDIEVIKRVVSDL